jgi:hypothetical protein
MGNWEDLDFGEPPPQQDNIDNWSELSTIITLQFSLLKII